MVKVSETPQDSGKSQNLTKVESNTISESSMSFIKKVLHLQNYIYFLE